MKQSRRTFLILLCALRCCCPAVGQTYNYAHYTTRDGLAGETLYTITQDAEGFMWFATETGLSRFDGHKFKNFTIADGLLSNEVFGFYEDAQNRLWIKSFSNEPCYFFKGRIHNRHNTPSLEALMLPAQLHSIFETKNGGIIFTDELGNSNLLERSGRVKKYGKRQIRIELAAVLRGSGIDARVLMLPISYRAALTAHVKDNPYFANNAIVKNGDLFIQISREFLKDIDAWIWFNPQGRRKILARPELVQALIDRGEILECYRKGGAGIFNLKSGQQTAVFLPNFIVNGMYRDRDGNIWFGTKWNGLFKLSNKDVVNLTFNTGNKSPAIQFVHAENGIVYVGDDNGGLWKVAVPDQKQQRSGYSFQKTRIFETVNWIEAHAAGSCIAYNGSDFLHLNFKGASQGVKTLNLSGDTLLMAVSDAAYMAVLPHLGKWTQIHKGRATCALKAGNAYYVGTLNGLLVYSREGALQSKPLDNRISFIAQGSAGQLWISTYDNGVYCLLDNKVVAHFNTQNSILSSNLSRCIFYQQDTVWVGTDKGICRIITTDTAHRYIAVYNQGNGLSSDIINTISVSGGTVYAGTSTGLDMFNDRATTGDTAINLAFTQIRIADTAIDLDMQVNLPHDDNSIRFDFSAISYAANKITYRYRLLGLSGQWRKTTEQTLSFLSLGSGRYRLQIQAIGPAGTKSRIIEKSFIVRQSLLEYWWMRLLLVLLVGAALFFLTYLRIKKIRRTEAAKREAGRQMLELEQMALRAQMNPHFIFNCLNSVQHFIMKGDAAGANLYLSRFAGLVRQTLENADKLLITLQEELNYLKHYIELEQVQVNYPFEYSITIDPVLASSSVLMPNMIIQPFVENAIKHGIGRKKAHGRLTIEVYQHNGLLVWTITDNGDGIKGIGATRRSAHQSKGISLIEKRINTLNLLRPDVPPTTYRISDLQETGSRGTVVTVHIPLVLNSSIKN